ncbi:hypothetical protein [Martelella soudanensis]|nr:MULTISPECIES: hypothetical protein [unclassified Martelella]
MRELITRGSLACAKAPVNAGTKPLATLFAGAAANMTIPQPGRIGDL